MKYFILCLILTFLLQGPSFGDEVYSVSLNWTAKQQLFNDLGEQQTVLHFEGAQPDRKRDFLPLYSVSIPLEKGLSVMDVQITNPVYELFDNGMVSGISGLSSIGTEIEPQFHVAVSSKKRYVVVEFIPVRFNPFFQNYEGLTSFDILIGTGVSPKAGPLSTSAWYYASESVLNSGSWYRIAVSSTGICRLTYDDLQNMGISVSSIDPRNLSIYGSKGGMLPESTMIQGCDDLAELPVFVSGEEDGVFNTGDYILFYSQSPDEWKPNPLTGGFRNSKNIYSDFTYYFITADRGPGKRIGFVGQVNDPSGSIVTSYDDYFAHEVDEVNLITSGRQWYGELFDLYPTLEQVLELPGLITSEPVTLSADVAARSFSPSSFRFFVDSDLKMTIPVSNVSDSPNTYYARSSNDAITFNPASATMNLKIEYVKPLSGSIGWLNYYQLNFRRTLNFRGGQMLFRDTRSAAQDSITEFRIGSANASVTVWDVTDITDVGRVETTLSGNQLSFRVETGKLREYVAFDGSQYISAQFVEKVSNQNLHGLSKVDMIIITHPLFLAQAERLARHHRDFDGLTVEVLMPQQIYNEFSSGAQDVTAIRNFMKMLYDRADETNMTRYLLLFGDGSFDYKNREANNTNFVPAWQSPESLHTVNSYVTDDFYGLLDDDPNDFMIDLGIGRFVVKTEAEAKNAVDKVIHYATSSSDCMGPWRNTVCLVADDEDSNLHLEDAEELATLIESLNSNINLDKIYLDAYQQASTPGGERYPDANLDINRRIRKGTLMLNYVGHGGEAGWAHERVLEIADINSWNNYDQMTIFVTATCEFSRFDDPGRTSAGEFVFLNPSGGGIALFTTTRATYAGSNSGLNKSFYKYALSREDGSYRRMGDIIRLAKTESGSNDNGRKFILMGDPALMPAFPEYTVKATKINNSPLVEGGDTITALSEVTISGEVIDNQGQLMNDFNGIIYPVVYDKPSRYNSLANDPESIASTFFIQNNALYNGKASVTSGEWTFSFIAPKDIAYQFDFGKLSFYAENDNVDATGYSFDVVVGGYNTNAASDFKGPDIDLYINDENFVSGGITGPDPVLYARVQDESGINTVGSGIGHNLTATLNYSKTYSLNDYYEAEVDEFRKGSISYPFYNLSDGDYTLNLKIWDVHNNSSTATIKFKVVSSDNLVIDKVFNYPNPFGEYTVFSFEHNQSDADLDISIRIFNLAGQQVSTITDVSYAGGYRYKSVAWDGTDAGGNKLNHGMYIYKVEVRSRGGLLDEATGKMVILR